MQKRHLILIRSFSEYGVKLCVTEVITELHRRLLALRVRPRDWFASLSFEDNDYLN